MTLIKYLSETYNIISVSNGGYSDFSSIVDESEDLILFG